MRGALLLLAAAMLLVAGGGALAQDAPPPELRASLAPLRGHFRDNPDTGGASPAFDPIKHKFRDWLLARLPPEKPTRESTEAFSDAVNSTLKDADLLCPAGPEDAAEGPCTHERQFFPLGYLDEVALDLRDAGNGGMFLVAKTGLGVSCGFDVSAYIFAWNAGAWRLAWQSEQNDYGREHYHPGWIGNVEIGPPEERSGARLVLTLGSNPACQSNFQAAYFRLWRMGTKLEESHLLLDRAEIAYLGRNDPALLGDLSLDEATVEFATPSLDVDVHNREAVFHFELSGNSVERTDPVALSPRDFVEEWLRSAWAESALWSEPRNRDALAVRHTSIHEGLDVVLGSFIDPTMRCTVRPGLWQVGLKLGASEAEREQRSPVYFLIRWQPPYRFRMVDSGDRPFPECFAPDPRADAWRTLFLGHGWQ